MLAGVEDFKKNKSLDSLITGLGKSSLSIPKAKKIEFSVSTRDICYLLGDNYAYFPDIQPRMNVNQQTSLTPMLQPASHRCSIPFHSGFPLQAAKVSSSVKRAATEKIHFADKQGNSWEA